MNREIKFRGKRVDNGEWVTGDLIHGQGTKYGRMFILPQSHIYPKGCNELDGWDVIPETVGQFTGLKDKNGVEIFEGDVVKVNIEGRDFVTIVSWGIQSHGWCLKCNRIKREGYGSIKYYKLPASHKIMVLGNVHDNLELIK